MTDNVTANLGAGGAVFKTDEISGVHTPISKVAFGVDGIVTTVDNSHALPVDVTFPSSQTVDGVFWQDTQPVSGTVTVNGTVTANTGIIQPVTDSQLRANDVKITLDGEQVSISNLPVIQPVSGPLTDTQMRASDVKVTLDGEQVAISNLPATQPISAVSLPLPTGAATQTTLSSIDTKFPAKGQATMALSTPVVLASNQSSIPVTGIFYQTTQPINAASLPLPSGAATETTLSSINTKTPSLGQSVMASSVPVTIASNQSTLPVNIVDTGYDIINIYMCNDLADTTMTSTLNVDGYSFTVASATGIAIGQCVEISQNGHVLQALISNLVGTTVTINVPSDKQFTSGALIQCGSFNMNVDGSSVRKLFHVGPPLGSIWHITSLIIGITSTNVMDDSKFGSLTSLSKGVVLRQVDGSSHNIFVVNDNGGWRERCFDVSYADKAPAGVYGFGAKISFTDESGSGTTVILNGSTGDTLEFIIQDNLTALTKFAATVQGHKYT